MRAAALIRPLLRSPGDWQLAFRFDGGFRGQETDLAVGAVTEGFVHRTPAAAQ